MRSIYEIQDEAGWSNDSLLELVMEWVGTYCYGYWWKGHGNILVRHWRGGAG